MILDSRLPVQKLDEFNNESALFSQKQIKWALSIFGSIFADRIVLSSLPTSTSITPTRTEPGRVYLSMSGKKSLLFSLMVLAFVCIASVKTSRADTVTFTIGNNPQQSTEENVLLNTNTTGITVVGTTNQSNIAVQFTSNIDTLTEPANGQARVEAVDGVLNNITISIPGGSFSDLIVNPFFGSGTATVTAVSTTNITSMFSYTLSNGQNFLTIVDTNGSLSSVTISAPGGFTDLRQVRISGAQLNTEAVPEPATLLLLGSGLLGLGSTLRKEKIRGK